MNNLKEHFDFLNLFETFRTGMVQNELLTSKVQLNKPIFIMPPERLQLMSEETKSKLLKLPLSLQYILLQAKRIMIKWNIKENTDDWNRIKNDDLIKSNYLGKNELLDETMDYVGGFVNIESLEIILNNGIVKFPFGHIFESLNEDISKFYSIGASWNIVAFVREENNEIKDNVWLLDSDTNRLYNMEVTVQKYLELAYKAKGFYNWQTTYLLKSKAPHYSLMKRFLPQIIEHVESDLSDFDID